MIAQVSNNRASGSTAKSCDAGVPVVGRTSSTGTYQILKVAADGSLATGGAPSSNVPYIGVPLPYALNPVALKGVGTIVYYSQFTTSSLDAGLYTINPIYLIDTLTAGGSVNFAIIKIGTAMDAYCSSRLVGTDAFAPSTTDFLSGYNLWFHNCPLEVISSVGMQGTASLNAQQKNVYLPAGGYSLLVWVHTAFTNNSPTGYVGFTEFTQIG